MEKQKISTSSCRNTPETGVITRFLDRHYRHFNAASLVAAAKAYREQIRQGNKMMISLAGAMSTAELGISLAEMIRRDKVHLICCTGANLEEDIFNLVAHDDYVPIPNYRYLNPQDEEALFKQDLNRITDVCIPEKEAMRRTEEAMLELWGEADRKGESYFPHEFFFQALLQGKYEPYYQIDPQDSWMLAAAQKGIPIVVPGWEDSSLGNVYAAACIQGQIKNIHTVRSGIEYMMYLVGLYQEMTKECSMGMLQIGGGISGDFPICVVPLLQLDMEVEARLWSYFCQISDSTTSYGSYSGAVPSEKITWGKLGVDTPSFVIESDATIVAPLLFTCILEDTE
jgi:deoxyhypusine synthase